MLRVPGALVFVSNDLRRRASAIGLSRTLEQAHRGPPGQCYLAASNIDSACYARRLGEPRRILATEPGAMLFSQDFSSEDQ